MTHDNAALALVIVGLALAALAIAALIVGTVMVVVWLASFETGQFVLLGAAAILALGVTERVR